MRTKQAYEVEGIRPDETTFTVEVASPGVASLLVNLDLW